MPRSIKLFLLLALFCLNTLGVGAFELKGAAHTDAPKLEEVHRYNVLLPALIVQKSPQKIHILLWVAHLLDSTELPGKPLVTKPGLSLEAQRATHSHGIRGPLIRLG
jgi:hypothetical protein